MISIRLLATFSKDHIAIPAGTVAIFPPDLARYLIRLGAAEMAEPEQAVVQPQEMRARGGKRASPLLDA